MTAQSIDKKIIAVINRKKHGAILFASDFADMGEQKTINKVFERITLSVFQEVFTVNRKSIPSSASESCIPVWMMSHKPLPKGISVVSCLPGTLH